LFVCMYGGYLFLFVLGYVCVRMPVNSALLEI
jgi:hypothetical protein